MSQSEQKIVQYLNEAHATEISLISVLRTHIAMTPIGSYRDGLEEHLDETRSHARRVEERLGKLGEGRNPIQVVLGYTEAVFGQMFALSKAPLELLRGSGGEEKVLKNAKDACATEALEIATYSALERLAARVGDVQTEKLAASIRRDEERMLKRIMREIPQLTDDVVSADLEDQASGEMAERGSGVGELEGPEPWPGYDQLSEAEIKAVLDEGDDQRAQDVVAYERIHKNRSEVLQSALIPARFSFASSR